MNSDLFLILINFKVCFLGRMISILMIGRRIRITKESIARAIRLLPGFGTYSEGSIIKKKGNFCNFVQALGLYLLKDLRD